MDISAFGGGKELSRMVGNSKILTVAYGTFSCTLEGFDDPFSTMKEIAEYFRELAAQDRYFGAEPPTPDADMLARIAERSSNATVKAEMNENSLTLRPAVAGAGLAAAAGVAAIAGVSGQDEVVPEVTPEVSFEDTIAALLHEEAAEVAPRVAEPQVEAEADIPGEALTLEDIVEDQPEEGSVEDRLARIQKVVAQEAASADADGSADLNADLSDDSDAQDFNAQDFSQASVSETRSEPESTDIAETAPEAEAAPVQEHAQEPVEEVVQDIVQDDTPEAVLEPAPAPAEESAQEAPAPLEETAQTQPPAVSVVRKVRKPEVEATPEPQAVAETTPEPESTGADVAEADVAGADAAEASDLPPEDEAELMAELAAIEAESEASRKGRAEALPPAADEDQEALDRLFADTDDRLQGEETSRRHANIAHLKAAVAARMADSGEDGDLPEDDTDAYRQDLASAVRPRRARPVAVKRTPRPNAPTAPLVLVSEQRVDAAKAEQAAAAAAAQDDGPVRPRRVRRAAEDVRAGDDTTAETLEAVSRAAPTPVAGGFEDFAEEQGAVEMIEVLEAAAAYTSMVEGAETFSRPQLMRLAAEAAEDFTREEGLRSFGELLRDGRIEKVSRGAFRLAGDSRYEEPARQRAAG